MHRARAYRPALRWQLSWCLAARGADAGSPSKSQTRRGPPGWVDQGALPVRAACEVNLKQMNKWTKNEKNEPGQAAEVFPREGERDRRGHHARHVPAVLGGRG